MEKKIKVWCNGCFDILHRGHLELLQFAKKQGDYLIVGIDCDERVSKNKGNDRPINREDDRKFLLENLKIVDEVVVFCSDQDLVEKIKDSGATLMVLGNDYSLDKVIRPEGFPVQFFQKLEGYSTTYVLNKKTN
jgi:rfaE bifunctional protein nucleotidyltransferase chain/domain